MSAVIVTPGLFLAWWGVTTWPSTAGLLLTGLLVGLLGSAVIAAWLARRERSILPIAVLLGGAAVGVGGLHLVNGALDDAQGRLERGVIVSAPRSASSSSTRKVQVRWSHGATEWIRASGQWRDGEAVERTTFPGALGFPWNDGLRDRAR